MLSRLVCVSFVLVAVIALLALGGCRAATIGQAAAPVKPGGTVEVDRETIAREVTWAPGQLQAHFEKHGREGPWASEAAYDASARETIRIGTVFTYLDRESNAERLGFYHRESNRFTSVTRDGRRITTQFRPDRGEVYVRGLDRSTYR
jgi:pyocin large subunit-like protein